MACSAPRGRRAVERTNGGLRLPWRIAPRTAGSVVVRLVDRRSVAQRLVRAAAPSLSRSGKAAPAAAAPASIAVSRRRFRDLQPRGRGLVPSSFLENAPLTQVRFHPPDVDRHDWPL